MVFGGSAPGLAGAEFLQAHFDKVEVFAKELYGNLLKSNEFYRWLLQFDNPLIWRTLTGIGLIYFGVQKLLAENAGYLIQQNVGTLPTTLRRLAHLNQTTTMAHLVGINDEELNKLLPKDTSPNVILGDSGLTQQRADKPYIHPSWTSALFSAVGGKIAGGMSRLTEFIAAADLHEGACLEKIEAGQAGKVKVKTRKRDITSETEVTDVFLALGPWLRQELLPDGIELPPSKVELHSIINIDFSDGLIHAIASVCAWRLLDPDSRATTMALGLYTGKEEDIDDKKITAMVDNIKANILLQVKEYGKTGGLIQNDKLAYITPIQSKAVDNDSRIIMLGREGDETVDADGLKNFPPDQAMPGEKLSPKAQARNELRKKNILSHARGIIAPIDALLDAIQFLKEHQEIDSYNKIRKVVDESMILRSGFYHVTSGIDVTADNFTKYQPLLRKYYEWADDSLIERNKAMLQEAGIDPELVVDATYIGEGQQSMPLCRFKNPFAVYLINKKRSEKQDEKLIVTIPDADIPYIDVIEYNGARIAIVASLRGRGFMGGPGAAKFVSELLRQKRDGVFDPESEFGRFMRQFSLHRLEDPAIMEELIRERIFGGSGDI